MKNDTLESLTRRRDELSSLADAMAATPDADRPKKPADRKAWLIQLEELRTMVDQFDGLIARLAPKPRVGAPDLVNAPGFESGDVITIVRVPKGRRAEMRVSVKPWQGRRVIDIRLWSLIDGAGGEMRPSRKGIAFDASKLDALIDALHQAKQHV